MKSSGITMVLTLYRVCSLKCPVDFLSRISRVVMSWSLVDMLAPPDGGFVFMSSHLIQAHSTLNKLATPWIDLKHNKGLNELWHNRTQNYHTYMYIRFLQ